MPVNTFDLFYHPEYERNKNSWVTWKALYEGEHQELVSARYLWRHILEKSAHGHTIRAVREERTRYTNFLEPVISAYTSLFFAKDPDIGEIETLFGDDIEDVDGAGKHFVTWIKEDVLQNYLIYGKPLILTDSLGVAAETKREEKALGKRPFFEVLHPLSVCDWAIENGRFLFLRHEYSIIEPRGGARDEIKITRYSKEHRLSGGRVLVFLYRDISENGSYREKDKNWELVQTEELDPRITELPISTIFNAESWIKDVAEEALRFHNIQSSYDNVLNNQAYQRSFVIGPELDPKDWKEIGEYVMGKLPDGSSVQTIEPADTTSLRERMLEVRASIFQIAFNQTRLLPSDSRAVESDLTIRERNAPLVRLILSSIKELETCINNAIRHYALFKGQPDFSGRIKLSREITEEDVTKMIEIFAATRDLIEGHPTWLKAVKKKIAGAQNLSNIEDVEKEIDAEAPPPASLFSRNGVRPRLEALLGQQTA